MRYLRPDDLNLVRQLAAAACSRRRPRRANRPRLYAPWPTLAPATTVPMGVLHRVLDGLQNLEVGR